MCKKGVSANKSRKERLGGGVRKSMRMSGEQQKTMGESRGKRREEEREVGKKGN